MFDHIVTQPPPLRSGASRAEEGMHELDHVKVVVHRCHLGIAEIKRNPSRRTPPGPERQRHIEELLYKAQVDLQYYAAMVFKRDPRAKQIVLVAAAGVYWKWIQVKRKHIVPWELQQAPDWKDKVWVKKKMMIYNKAGLSKIRYYQLWTACPLLTLGSVGGDAGLTEVRRSLITILNRHVKKGATVARPPLPASHSDVQMDAGQASQVEVELGHNDMDVDYELDVDYDNIDLDPTYVDEGSESSEGSAFGYDD